MKHGLKPTKAQKLAITEKKLNYSNWLVVKDTPELFVIVHRESGNQKEFRKGKI